MSLYMGTLQIVQNFKRELEGYDEDELSGGGGGVGKSPLASTTPVVDAKPRSLNLEKVRERHARTHIHTYARTHTHALTHIFTAHRLKDPILGFLFHCEID